METRNSSEVRVASYNANGVLNPIKRSKILSKLKRDKAQVIYLQETHMMSDSEAGKLKRMGFKYVFSSNYKNGHRRGVAILISGNVQYENVSEIKDKEGRYIMIRGRLEGTLVTLFNIYAPPGSKWEFYRQMFDLMAVETQGILVCGGDLNVRLNPKLDSTGGNLAHSNTISRKIRAIMSEMGIIDVWRDLNPTGKDYTYYSSPHATYSRIDYFLTYKRDRHRVRNCEIGTIDLSDHSPVYMSLSVGEGRKATLWKLNSSILTDPMKEQLKTEIQTYLVENDNGEVSPPILWDACKAVMRGKLIAKSALLKRMRQERLNRLQLDLKQLERNHKDSQDPNTYLQLLKKKNEINEIYSQEIQKKLVFLKQKYYETGNKSAKLLAYKLRKQQVENGIYKIRDPQTKSTHCKMEDIQGCFEKYYKNLYSQSTVDDDTQLESFLNSLNLPTVTEGQNTSLIAEITPEELNTAIARLKANKAPGTDGFTSEWYKSLREPLTPMLLDTFNWVLEKGEIPPSWREAIISVIPKEGKDRMECANFRPISVLNQDYKLFTSILARRIEIVLPDIINIDQTGFIRQRQTQDSIRRSLHVMRHITKKKVEAVLVALDAEKAFDSVRWAFLYKVLQKFGFHETLIKTIQTLYDRPSARVKINGGLSRTFTLERGCRQGCPASPLLFAIFIEPLSQWIRQNKDIKGIDMAGGEQKLALFADDVLLYVGQPAHTIPILMSTLEEYGTFSGYKLNVQKTQALTFNYNPAQSIRDRYHINPEAETMKYLGVTLPRDLRRLSALNYDPLISKIKKDLARWNLLPFLSMGSRIESIKMNILPRLLYLFQTLPVEVTDRQFVEWDKLISRYIWQGKKPRIRYKTLQLHKDKGGLALPSLKDYYKAAQIKPLVCLCNPSYTARWKEIECEMTQGVPIQAMVGERRLVGYLEDKDDQWINLALKIWHDVIRSNNMKGMGKVLQWCAFDLDFAPNRIDHRFRSWIRRDLTAYCTFINQGRLMSFQDLKDKHGLTNQDFYRYLQVRHQVEQIIRKDNLESITTGVLKVFITAYNSEPCYGIISKLYNGLRKLKEENTLYIKEKWEGEGNFVMSVEEWERLNQQQWKTTCSSFWREFGWKNITRFFVSPAQKKHQVVGSGCWRQCGSDDANHFHIFWGCPPISPFWQGVHGCMEDILHIQLPFSFEVLYLGKVAGEFRAREDKYLFNIMLVAIKKGLTRKWMKPEVPTVEDWIDIMYEIFVMERITFSLRLQQARFAGIWERWIEYITPLRPHLV